ncbi:protein STRICTOSIDINE SYNTHASE-LIKE 10-like [Impatiens glandulifera]|uniref:protein STRICTOSIDINE SYNTHASE-LIKE 10-like n=1 Tax=Impatiens glandulifera TaxID=253017 RepID=UPI001FB1663D|nr:protein STRICTOSIDINE SYNTHASE-LIKE 10-like [Impatiens glandulifera]
MKPGLIHGAAALAALSIFVAFNFNHLLAPPIIPQSQDFLHKAEINHLIGAFGPESLAFDANGDGPYTGVADGRILKWVGAERRWIDFAVTSSNRENCTRPFALDMEHICGRPLGLRFDRKTGDLYIADAYLGLHVVGSNGGLASKLVTEFEGKPLVFTNDIDIDEDENVLYFSDSSTIFQRRQFMASVLSGDRTGRLMKYDRSTKEVTVLLKGLAFANGVALSKDRSFVLIAETSTCRIHRLWLKGSKTGQSEIFSELPGFPDNIRRNSEGEFWVALHSKKGPISHAIVANPWIGKIVLRLPINFKQLHYLLVGGKPHATVIKLNENGEIVKVLEDCEGKSLKFISEAEEKDGKLWLGSVLTPSIGVYSL